MKLIRFIVLLLMVIGSLNWGLVGFFQYDLVSDICGGMNSTAARIIYALVGLAGLYGIGFLCRCCGRCKTNCNCGPNCGCGSKGCGSNCNCGPNCKCNEKCGSKRDNRDSRDNLR